MTRTFAFILVSAAAIATGACADHSPQERIAGVAPREASGFRVSIEGPKVVPSPGFHEWTAIVEGGGDDVSYEWTLLGTTRPVFVTGTDADRLLVTLDDYYDGQLELNVLVRSGDRTAVASEIITMCPQRHAMDLCFPLNRLAR